MKELALMGRLLATLVGLLLPGHLLYTRVLYNDDDSAVEMLSASFACSVVAVSAVAFAAFLLRWPQMPVRLGLYGGGVVALGYWRPGPRRRDVLPLLLTFVCFCALALHLMTIVPSYEAAFARDWSLYFPNTAIYLGRVQATAVASPLGLEYLIKRTPFFSLANAFFLGFGERTYGAHQVISVALNGLAFLSLYGMSARLGSRARAFFVLGLVPFVPLLLFGVIIPTPKFLAAFCTLTTAQVYWRIREDPWSVAARRRLILCAISGAAAFMAHPSALFYLSILFLDQLLMMWRNGTWRRVNGTASALVAGAVAVIVVPWFIWGIATFGLHTVIVPTDTISESRLTFAEYFRTRWIMIATSAFLPLSAFNAVQEWWRTGTASAATALENPFVRFYWETLLGGLTITGTTCGIVAWVSPRERAPLPLKRLLQWTLLGAGVCIGIFMMIDLEGHAMNLLSPLTLIWFVLLFGQISAAGRGVRMLTVAGVALECVIAMRLVFLVTSREEKIFRFVSDDVNAGQAPILWAAVLVVLSFAYWASLRYALRMAAPTTISPSGSPTETLRL